MEAVFAKPPRQSGTSLLSTFASSFFSPANKAYFFFNWLKKLDWDWIRSF
jgi:hypothetical protein